jgi:hypothetical protein
MNEKRPDRATSWMGSDDRFLDPSKSMFFSDHAALVMGRGLSIWAMRGAHTGPFHTRIEIFLRFVPFQRFQYCLCYFIVVSEGGRKNFALFPFVYVNLGSRNEVTSAIKVLMVFGWFSDGVPIL